MERLPVKTFKNLTSTEMQTIAEDYGWDIIKNNERGYAFQRWCADLLCSYDQGLDTEPGDALLYSHDLGADLVLEDTTRKHLVVVQCKYHSLGKKLSPINEGPVNDFFNKHKDFSNSRWVPEHGSEQAIDALGDYAEKVSDGYKIEYYFMSTGGASERVQELVENSNNDYQNRDLDVTCRLYEFNELKAFYVRAQSLEESIPVQVELQLPSNKYIIKDERRRTLIATIKGNTLRDLYRRYKEALFAYNIRGYLGDRGINKDTTKTAQNRAPDFFYFNNGVSAICTSMEFKDHKLIANKFQIINGAQTVGALYRADANPDIEVLMRVTETLGVASEKGINEDIILYNNSQNIIKVSDFRSNDPIQRHIEQLFKKLKPQGPPSATCIC